MTKTLENSPTKETLKVNIKKLDPKAVLPKKAHFGDAGFDLIAISKKQSIDKGGFRITYKTGLAFEIPEGYVGLLFSRNSIHKTPLTLTNSVGVIDSGYRGEISFVFRIDPTSYTKPYDVGDRIGQIIIMPYPDVQFNLVDILDVTEQNNQGVGSSDQ